MNTMVVVDQQQQQPQQSQATFAPLSTVQPSAAVALVNGCMVDGFALAQQQPQKGQQWGQSPPNSATPSAATARTIMFSGNTNGTATGAPGNGHPTKLSLPVCSGCGQPILDKYVLHVAPDATWHADCLRCAECSQPLDETCTCYVRNGHAYCKSDYSKLFGVRCARCQKSFSRLDSIMRVRTPTTGANALFHTDCFMCYACGCPLLPGTRFALIGGGSGSPCGPNGDNGSGGDLTLLLCERDFDDRPHFLTPLQPQQSQQTRVIRPTPTGPPMMSMTAGDSPMIENHHPFMVNGSSHLGPSQQQQQAPPPHILQGLHHMPPDGNAGMVMLEPPQGPPPQVVGMMGDAMAMEAAAAAGVAMPGQVSQSTPNGNGLVHRPTPTSAAAAAAAAAAALHHNPNNSNNKHHGGDHKGCEKSSSVSSCGSASTGGNGGVVGNKQQLGGGGRSRESKTTRVRTVLNEKQLNTLRACYAANPRPDALMKEQLVEMTGLSPRVIRVWFQNKRCKDKKKSILMKLQAQHLSNSDKVAALQSAMPIIAQDAMPHSGESPINGSEVAIHAFSQSAWKSLADFAMNADIEPSASFQQFVNGVDGNSKNHHNHHNNHLRNHRMALHHHNTTSDGISDDDDDDDDDDNEVLGGDDDDDMMMMGGGGCSSTSPTRGGATTTTTTTTTPGDDESTTGMMNGPTTGGPFSTAAMMAAASASPMSILSQRQQLLVDTTTATICNRL